MVRKRALTIWASKIGNGAASKIQNNLSIFISIDRACFSILINSLCRRDVF